MYVKTVEEAAEEFTRLWADERGQPRSPSITDVLVKLEEMQAMIDKMEGQLYDLWVQGR